ncbi:MAG: acylneuraminate cytidylyltransferase family protein [Gammaproteobacteria bacterium]|nr:acylneuraminate cytidylyltransferase family protein [Gammaproteobacteria bacterium]MBT5644610.1 acylneuraminate cytidylyltransferase family protein [Gammaproteobacteria bacterium]MBT6733859.1 acylneuraminate cytidylyltransferase family protein [Gammaproteobacteria bacterium]
MNIICIIPARGNSKEIIDKNIINFCGKPLIAWSIEQALASEGIKDVYVSSDSDKILQISKEYGAKEIKRPDNIARDESTSEEALIHAINEIERDNGKIDLVVFLQGTSPLRSSEDIDKAIALFINNQLDSLFSACDLKDLMVWKNIEDNLTSINYDYENRKRRQDMQKQYGENGSIYIFKPKVIKQNMNRLGGKIGIYIMNEWKIHEIDTKEDIGICEYFMNKKELVKNK